MCVWVRMSFLFMNKKKILIIFGTRPEVIKLSPIIKLLKKKKIEIINCAIYQHTFMLEQAIEYFNIKIDYKLKIKRNKNDLHSLLSTIIKNLKNIIKKIKPDLVIVQGDTTSALGGAICANYLGIKVAHIESGLRTGNNDSPWPEEINRKIISSISFLHFAPTELNKKNLLDENISSKKIFVTGNTVIDTIKNQLKNLKGKKLINLRKKFINLKNKKKIILVTGHRRENLKNNSFREICIFLNLVAKFEKFQIILMMHLNPEVVKIIKKNIKNSNIKIIKPVDYSSFIYLLKKSYIVISDSGGIQEETAYLGKPLLLTRHNTERPEGYKYNSIKLNKVNIKNLKKFFFKLTNDKYFYNKKTKKTLVFGNGMSSQYIYKILKKKIIK